MDKNKHVTVLSTCIIFIDIKNINIFQIFIDNFIPTYSYSTSCLFTLLLNTLCWFGLLYIKSYLCVFICWWFYLTLFFQLWLNTKNYLQCIIQLSLVRKVYVINVHILKGNPKPHIIHVPDSWMCNSGWISESSFQSLKSI